MSRSSKDYEIGYGRPPKATQWKKGQSPNPGGQSSRRSIDDAETIDKLLSMPVKVTVNGESKRVAVLKVILEQLWKKAFAGDRRARAVFLRWLELAPQVADRTVEITFADSDYTRDFSAHDVDGSGDE
jgi:Family of unknown function (DUF5681)